MQLRASLLLAGTAIAVGTFPAAAGATTPGVNGRIAFSSQDDLWSVQPDGTDLRRITSTPDVEEAQASWSPDGRYVAFRKRPAAGAPFQVYVADVGTGAVRRVSSSTVNESQPGWSPDGTRIVFRRGERGAPNADVWVMRADGTDARPLVVTPGADERYPGFSPDGKRLAFSSNRDGQYEVYVSRADGSAPVRLTDDPGYDSAPSWSPDGRRIAFERGTVLDADATKDVWIMRADGAGQRRLTTTAGVDEGPSFSPDGRWIAFTSGRDGNYEAYRMRADGSRQTRVIALPTMEESPDWQVRPAGRGSGVLRDLLAPLFDGLRGLLAPRP
jgi:Tol biopolymer transport system component